MRPTVKLWEIATIQAWWTPNRSKKEYYEWWNIPRLKSWELNDSISINENEEFITELWMENSSAKLFKKWTLLMAMYWATAWKLWILNIDATTNQAVCSIQNTKWLFDNLYVFYYLFLIRNKIIIDSFWWAQPNISKDYIKNIEIPLPPLETQKAIVAKLDQIFAELDQTKSEIQKNLDNTDELWKSALNQAFQGDWEMKTLQDVCLQKITDWTHQTPTYCGEKEWIPFISSKDVTKEYIDREWWIKYIPQSLHEELYARIAPQKDDVLLAKNWTTWVAAIVEDDRIFDIYVTLAVLRPNQKIITPRFLHRIVNSPICKRQFDKSLKWAGVPNLHLENIKTVTIPVPPLSEQEKIVEHLDQVSKEVKALKSQYQSQLDNLEELKKSVLDKAFRWEMGE